MIGASNSGDRGIASVIPSPSASAAPQGDEDELVEASEDTAVRSLQAGALFLNNSNVFL